MATERTYHDPLHGAITLSRTDRTEALLIELIDTPAFQRLRRIRQLGLASLTFHGGEASRFTHSLGVMAITRRAFDRLCTGMPELLPYRALVLCASLLHDIGHGPFSHTGEELFRTHHEIWTCKILNESLPIQTLLDSHDPSLRSQLVQIPFLVYGN
jgi:HD superfamily phosphohydrolase